MLIKDLNIPPPKLHVWLACWFAYKFSFNFETAENYQLTSYSSSVQDFEIIQDSINKKQAISFILYGNKKLIRVFSVSKTTLFIQHRIF